MGDEACAAGVAFGDDFYIWRPYKLGRRPEAHHPSLIAHHFLHQKSEIRVLRISLFVSQSQITFARSKTDFGS